MTDPQDPDFALTLAPNAPEEDVLDDLEARLGRQARLVELHRQQRALDREMDEIEAKQRDDVRRAGVWRHEAAAVAQSRALERLKAGPITDFEGIADMAAVLFAEVVAGVLTVDKAREARAILQMQWAAIVASDPELAGRGDSGQTSINVQVAQIIDAVSKPVKQLNATYSTNAKRIDRAEKHNAPVGAIIDAVDASLGITPEEKAKVLDINPLEDYDL